LPVMGPSRLWTRVIP